MLRIKNHDGEEIMRLYDDGKEEVFDQKLKEQLQKEKEKQEPKGE